MESGCEHRFVHLDTRKVEGKPGSIGLYSTENWMRIDRYFCEKCLETKFVRREASYYEHQNNPPDWW
jgi:hypothetical protein